MKLIKNPPDVLVDVSIPFAGWTAEEKTPATTVTRAVKDVFFCAPLPPEISQYKNIEISVLLGNDDLIRALNREYREKDKPTNVLSFPQYDGERLDPSSEAQTEIPSISLGDLVFAYETIKEESESKLIPFEAHLSHLAVHGTLHLLGYDHNSDSEAEQMEEMEIWIMNRMGYKNPYAW